MPSSGTCSVCFVSTNRQVCEICSDPGRDRTILCVVAEPGDVSRVERAQVFAGVYHVLGGVINPPAAIGPDQLRMNELLLRMRAGEVREVLLVFGPRVEDEATALYVHRLLKPFEVKLTRLPL
jgi:recombination protein RecR